MDLVEAIYKLTFKLPPHEKFALASQLQHAAISIPSNIAEGSKRGSRADFKQFCNIALGSAAEVETQLLLVYRLYPNLADTQIVNDITEIQKMLTSLTNSLRNKPLKTVNYQLKTT